MSVRVGTKKRTGTQKSGVQYAANPSPAKNHRRSPHSEAKSVVRLTRVLISFLLGGLAFLVLLVVSGNKTISEVMEMLKGLFQ